MVDSMQFATGHYAQIGALNLYYEIHGSGRPLVLLHGGGSTIGSTFGFILSRLAENHRLIAVELQAHGRTKDIDRPLSFEQDADDVAALLARLRIEKADIMGFSNGATTTLQIAIRHPGLVNKLVLVSTAYRRDGLQPGFFDGFANANLDMMPAQLQKAFLQVNPDRQAMQVMFERDVARMVGFKDIPDAAIQAIQAPALVMNGDQDVTRTEHALALSRLIPHARLAILPGGHDLLGNADHPDNRLPTLAVAMIDAFLE